MSKFRVFIVDDSVVYRSQIRMALEGMPEIEVAGFASNGRIACDLLRNKPVDLITLDMEMPEMDGLATLAELKRLNITAKVVVFSAQSKKGAESTITALRLGASDFIAKPNLEGVTGTPAEVIRAHLGPKVLALLGPAPSMPKPASVTLPNSSANPAPSSPFGKTNWGSFMPSAVVIASSTGGPNALEKLFSLIQGPLTCPVLMVQHMPPVFTATLAERLGRISGLSVAEGKHGEPIKAGQVYMAPGDWHMRVEQASAGRMIALDQSPMRNFVRPAADHLFETAAAYGRNILGIVLTGMGADGRDGAVALKKGGAGVLIQSRETCVVFGMPGAVCESGAYDSEISLEEIASMLSRLGVVKLAGKAA